MAADGTRAQMGVVRCRSVAFCTLCGYGSQVYPDERRSVGAVGAFYEIVSFSFEYADFFMEDAAK